jgi:hypothetical protein
MEHNVLLAGQTGRAVRVAAPTPAETQRLFNAVQPLSGLVRMMLAAS